MHSLTVPKLGVNSQQAADLSAEPPQHWAPSPRPDCAPRPAQPRPARGPPPRDAHPMSADRQGDRRGPEWAGPDGGLPQPRPRRSSAHPVGHVNACPGQRGRRAPTPLAAAASSLQPPSPVLSTRLTHAPPPHHPPHPATQLQRLSQHRLSQDLHTWTHFNTNRVEAESEEAALMPL